MDGLLQVFDSSHLAGFFSQLDNDLIEPSFWLSVGEIIWINLLLSGDNALVIALACRGLSPRHRLWGMLLGAGAAILLRVLFTGLVATLLTLPYLKLIGGLALIVIAAKLLVPDKEDDDVASASYLWAAVRIVVVADIVMSLDNVIAVAAAANGSIPLLVLGLAISIPLIVAGAALISAVLERLPILVWLGAALLGWIAGEVITTDPAIHPLLGRISDAGGATVEALDRLARGIGSDSAAELLCAIAGATIVLIIGSLWRRRAARATG